MPNVSVLVKPASALCNLRCEYCFYHDEASQRESFDFGWMSDQTAELLIDRALDFADGGVVGFCFQGGEPTLVGLPFYKKFVAYAAKRKTQGEIRYSLQTNGTNIDEDWCAFFAKHGFLVGVSIDGGSMQNGHRIDRDGRFVYERVMRGIRLLQEKEVAFNVLSVVTSEVADNAEDVYRWFKSQGLDFLQFIPCLRPLSGESNGDFYLTAEQYADFQTTMFGMYLADYIAGRYVSIRQFDNLVRMAAGGRAEQCGMTGHCGMQLVVESNGNVYPCDFYCLDDYLLGNINQSTFAQIVASPKARDFVESSLVVADKCKQCQVFALCRGGCKRYSLDMDYCTANKKFLTANLDKIVQAARLFTARIKKERESTL